MYSFSPVQQVTPSFPLYAQLITFTKDLFTTNHNECFVADSTVLVPILTCSISCDDSMVALEILHLPQTLRFLCLCNTSDIEIERMTFLKYVLLVGNHLFMLNLEDPYVTNQNCS